MLRAIKFVAVPPNSRDRVSPLMFANGNNPQAATLLSPFELGREYLFARIRGLHHPPFAENALIANSCASSTFVFSIAKNIAFDNSF